MRTLVVVLLLVGWGGMVAAAFPLTILYTNDLHARMNRLDSLTEHISAERETGATVLLFDAGDTWHDLRQPLPMVWGDRRVVAWMNEVGYSAMAVGNHDATWGAIRLEKRIDEAKFPVLCANWVPSGSAASPFRAATTIQVGASTILVIGLITSEFLPTAAYPHLRILDPVRALNDQLRLHEGTFDFVFVLGHIALNNARQIARQVPEIDLFISGHSHERTDVPIREGETLLVQSGRFGQALGRLRVDLGSERVSLVSNDLLETSKTPTPLRAGVLQFLVSLAALATATALWWF